MRAEEGHFLGHFENRSVPMIPFEMIGKRTVGTVGTVLWDVCPYARTHEGNAELASRSVPSVPKRPPLAHIANGMSRAEIVRLLKAKEYTDLHEGLAKWAMKDRGI